jgi:hypothetical protein
MSQIVAALAPIASVTDVNTVTLPPTQSLEWSDQLLASYDSTTTLLPYALIGVGTFVLLVFLIMCVLVQQRRQRPIMLIQPPESGPATRSILRIKIM